MPRKRPRQVAKVAYSESDSEYDDEIQTYHKQKDKILLDSDQEDADSAEEEEVYGLGESDSEDEEIAQMQQQLRQIKRNKIKKKLESDLEDDTEDEALPDSRAWGSKKSWFMGGDVRDNKIILSGDEDEAGAALLEEKELQERRKRHLARMSAEDFLPPSIMMMLKKEDEKQKKKQKKKKSSEDWDAKETKESDETSEKEEDEKKKDKKKKEKKKKPSAETSEKEENEKKTDKKKKDKKKKKSSVESDTGEIEKIQIQTDLSEEAEFERMKEMHPEYMPLVNDFGLKMRELQERIIPLMGLVKKGKIEGQGATYVRMKFHVISTYLICGGFYLYFMSLKTPRMHQHPVMKRLLEFQQFYNQLVPTDKRLKADLDVILERLRQGKDVEKVVCAVSANGDASSTAKKKKKKTHKAEQTEGPPAKKQKMTVTQQPEFEEGEEDDDDDDDDLGRFDEDEGEEEEEDEQGRRAITYEMEKNKGLTAHRKKDQKNPRVKHRKKYRRALIRRKGQVRDFKPPKQVYTGEMTGIRAGIIRSRKLK